MSIRIGTEIDRNSVFTMRNLSNITATIPKRLGIVLTLGAVTSFVTVALIYAPANASDPAPVNPRGPIPAVLSDSDGNTYEVFTPEEGGAIVGEDYSFTAVPGDVPSAYIVGVRMSKGGEASNAGMTHHRYALSGNYFIIDAVDEYGKTPSPRFRFRNPPLACLPIPQHFFANIDSMALIATDSEGSTQTVLNSGTRVQGTGLKLCAFVGTVPTILAVGLEGAPGPLPPTPEVVLEVRVVELPVTGGLAPHQTRMVLFLVLGITIVFVGYSVSKATRRRDR